jgi:hypothetical protein
MGSKNKLKGFIDQMNTIEISNDETLNHALVQCLRLFAQRGRMIRNQDLSSDKHAVDDEMIKTSSKVPNNEKADNQK